MTGYIVELSVGNRPRHLPGIENSADSAPELLPGVIGEGSANHFANLFLELADKLLQVLCRQIGVLFNPPLLFLFLQYLLEHLTIHAHDDIAVHLDKTTVRVVTKTWILGLVYQSLNGIVIEAEV